MKSNIILFLLTILVSGCATSGSSTLYSSTEKNSIQKIGFVDFSLDTVTEKIFGRSSGPFQGAVSTAFTESDSVLATIYSKANETFRTTVKSSFRDRGVDSVLYINERLNYYFPDSVSIINYCSNFKLDGIIVSKFKFIRIKEILFPFYITLAKKYYSEIGMMLFDRHGKLITSILYNTLKGNSYFWTPKADVAVKDGTVGAVNTLCIELNLGIN